MDAITEALREHVLTHSLKRGEFTLKSGATSAWFLDTKQTACRPEGILLVAQAALADRLGALLPDYQPMGGNGMYEHAEHASMGHMQGPENTLPMAMGRGPFGPIGMGGMMTLLRVRPDYRDGVDPGWYSGDQQPRARRITARSEADETDHSSHHR